MVELEPIRETPELYDGIEAEIKRIFREEIYLPLLIDLGQKKPVLKNALDDLLSAIASGAIYFDQGKFKGGFNSTLSKELKKLGATWDRRNSSWNINLSALPAEVRGVISGSEHKFTKALERIDRRLAEVNPAKFAENVKLEKLFDQVLWKVDNKVTQSLKGLVVGPKLTPENRALIAKDYTQNLQLYIQKFTAKETVELRKSIIEHAANGARYDVIAKEIQKSYGVSARKAKFLARQETSLLMTRFKQYRYSDAGIKSYKWVNVVGSPLHPVRPMHKALNGKIFEWDKPPITDKKGSRNNPGQDYNCRCTAIPIIKF